MESQPKLHAVFIALENDKVAIANLSIQRVFDRKDLPVSNQIGAIYFDGDLSELQGISENFPIARQYTIREKIIEMTVMTRDYKFSINHNRECAEVLELIPKEILLLKQTNNVLYRANLSMYFYFYLAALIEKNKK